MRALLATLLTGVGPVLLICTTALSGCDKLSQPNPANGIKKASQELDARNFGAAENQLVKLEENFPENAEVALLRAEFEATQGNPRAAVTALRRYLRLKPSGVADIESSNRLDAIRQAPEFLLFSLSISSEFDSLSLIEDADSAGPSEGDNVDDNASIKEFTDRTEIRAGEVFISVPK